MRVAPQVRETKMNQNSSRSHVVVRLYIESRPSTCISGRLSRSIVCLQRQLNLIPYHGLCMSSTSAFNRSRGSTCG